MLKTFFMIITIFSITHGNIFIITDHKGRVVQSKKIKHSENDCINQKSTEYSLQAIYDELRKAENLAHKADEARKRTQRIAKAQKSAKKAGTTYKISETDRKKLLKDAKYFKGGKYVWGGTTPQGFDCSGYVQYLYKKHNVDLPRTAYAQSKRGEFVSMSKLQKGDLLFFLTDKKRDIPITHVGIYLGNGRFIHAASKDKGIIVSPLFYGYYSNKFVSAKRVITKS